MCQPTSACLTPNRWLPSMGAGCQHDHATSADLPLRFPGARQRLQDGYGKIFNRHLVAEWTGKTTGSPSNKRLSTSAHIAVKTSHDQHGERYICASRNRFRGCKCTDTQSASLPGSACGDDRQIYSGVRGQAHAPSSRPACITGATGVFGHGRAKRFCRVLGW